CRQISKTTVARIFSRITFTRSNRDPTDKPKGQAVFPGKISAEIIRQIRAVRKKTQIRRVCSSIGLAAVRRQPSTVSHSLRSTALPSEVINSPNRASSCSVQDVLTIRHSEVALKGDAAIC